MILISHRGNLFGPSHDEENTQTYIDVALEAGFDVELDVWAVGGELFLGHDEPRHQVEIDWLRERSANLWVHSKNVASIPILDEAPALNWFFHETDQVTITSRGFVWCYPGIFVSSSKSVELNFSEKLEPEVLELDRQRYAICGDHVGIWREMIHNSQLSGP